MQKRYWLLCCLILLGVIKLGEMPEGGRVVVSPSPTVSAPSAPAKLALELLPPSVSANRSTPVPTAQETERAEPKFVRGNSVALRQAPNAKASTLNRLNLGKQMMVLAREGQWSRVRDNLTRCEGWVATRFLSDDELVAKQEAPQAKQTVEVSRRFLHRSSSRGPFRSLSHAIRERARARTARTGAAENAVAGALIRSRECIRRSALPAI